MFLLFFTNTAGSAIEKPFQVNVACYRSLSAQRWIPNLPRYRYLDRYCSKWNIGSLNLPVVTRSALRNYLLNLTGSGHLAGVKVNVNTGWKQSQTVIGDGVCVLSTVFYLRKMLLPRNGRFMLRMKLRRLGQRQCASVVEPLEAVSDQSTDTAVRDYGYLYYFIIIIINKAAVYRPKACWLISS